MFVLGFALGFGGYVLLGNINLTVVQLSVENIPKRLWSYISLVAFMEFAYCTACLTGMEALLRRPEWVTRLEWLAVFVFLLLGLLSFFHREEPIKISPFSGLGRGIFAALVNPLQVPFWLGWGVYMSDNNWMKNDLLSIASFAAVTSVGTIAILWLYAIAGKKIVEKLKLERVVLDKLIGILLMALACWELYKLLKA